MVKGPTGLYVLWEEERLLQSLGHQTNMPPTIMLEDGIIRDWHIIYLQHG